MIPTLSQIFDCLRKSGLRLTPHKCEFGMKSITFLGNTITPQGLKPETEKNREVSENYTQRRSGASQHMTKTSIILICVYILF